MFACKGCREVARLVGEVEYLRQMMVPAWCDFCCCKQNCHYCIGIMMLAPTSKWRQGGARIRKTYSDS